jgi:hypothetical protein
MVWVTGQSLRWLHELAVLSLAMMGSLVVLYHVAMEAKIGQKSEASQWIFCNTDWWEFILVSNKR